MAGRKRKIPPGFMPQWDIDSDQDNLDSSTSEQNWNCDSPKRIRVTCSPTAPSASSAPSAPRVSTSITPTRESRTTAPSITEVIHEPGTTHEAPGTEQETTGMEHEADNEDHHLINDVSFGEDHTQTAPHEDIEMEGQNNQHEINDVSEPNEFEGEEAGMDWDHNLFPTQNHPIFAPLLEEMQAAAEAAAAAEEHEEEEEQEDDEEEDVWSNSETEEAPVDQESYQYVLKELSEEWMSNETSHKVSKVASSQFWNIMRKWMFQVTSSFIKENKRKFPKFAHIRRKLKKENVPPISLDTGYVNKETNELSTVKDTDKVPVSDFPPDRFEKVFEIAHVKVFILTTALQLQISSLL